GISVFADDILKEYLNQPEAFASQLRQFDLELASVNIGIHTNFDEYRQVCKFMEKLGCTHLVCVGGFGKEQNDFKALGHLLNHIGSIALQYNVRAVYH